MGAISETLQKAYDQAQQIFSETSSLEQQGWIISQLVNVWSTEKKGIDPVGAQEVVKYLQDFILYPKPHLGDEPKAFPSAEELLAQNPHLPKLLERLKLILNGLDIYPQIRPAFFGILINLLTNAGKFDDEVKEDLERYYWDILSDPNIKTDLNIMVE